MRYETISDATHEWVKEFNAFPLGMIQKLFNAEVDDWAEITPISKYDRVYYFGTYESGEVTNITHDDYGNRIIEVELDNGNIIKTNENELEKENDNYFPMWGTMWQFGDSCDDWWLENDGGLEIMAECGFRIYESYEFGYFFGIDGAGYDFYEQHWIPLYKARGLKWHDEE